MISHLGFHVFIKNHSEGIGSFVQGVIQMGSFNAVIQGHLDEVIQGGHSMTFKAVNGSNMEGSFRGVHIGDHLRQSLIKILGGISQRVHSE